VILSLLVSFAAFVVVTFLVLCVIGVAVRALMWLCKHPFVLMTAIVFSAMAIIGVK